MTIPQTEEPTFSDSEANELLEALNIGENSGIPEFNPDGINGNSGLMEFDGLIDLGIDLNIPLIVSQNGSVQRDCGVKVNSDKREESGKSDTESEKSNLEEL